MTDQGKIKTKVGKTKVGHALLAAAVMSLIAACAPVNQPPPVTAPVTTPDTAPDTAPVKSLPEAPKEAPQKQQTTQETQAPQAIEADITPDIETLPSDKTAANKALDEDQGVLEETLAVEPQIPAALEADNTAAQDIAPQADNQTQTARPLAEVEAKPQPQPESEPEPEPEPEPIDPLDPHHLLGLTKAEITTRIGEADFAFHNAGITIAHYRHDACQILLFYTSDDGATGKGAQMTHVNIRPVVLEGAVSMPLCFEALGMRADFHKTR